MTSSAPHLCRRIPPLISRCHPENLWSRSTVSAMEVALLVFLSLITSAEATRKFISPPVVLPGDYSEEKEDSEDDADNDTDVEGSPANFAFTRGVKEESFEEEQTIESIFGPHYLTTLINSQDEEPPLDDMAENSVKVSGRADLLQRNTAEEESQENSEVNVMLIISCVTLSCSILFMVCCCASFIKYRLDNGDFSSCEHLNTQQKEAFPLYSDPVSRAPDNSQKNSWEPTPPVPLPVIKSVADLSVSSSSGPSSVPSYEELKDTTAKYSH